MEPNDRVGIQGRPTQLDCRAIGSTGIYYIWFRENTGVVSSNSRRKVLPNGTLYFSLADRATDNGKFYCEAVNGQNQRIQSRMASLSIHCTYYTK